MDIRTASIGPVDSPHECEWVYVVSGMWVRWLLETRLLAVECVSASHSKFSLYITFVFYCFFPYSLPLYYPSVMGAVCYACC